jgi:uncharacterized protein (UPF0264 family)
LAEQSVEAAIYLADSIVRTVRQLGPPGKKLYPAVFVDEDMCRFFKPFKHSLELAKESKSDGILIDTFNKLIGKGLLDYCDPHQIADLVRTMHRQKKELWIAGSITREELPDMWATGVDVICVRGAACESTGKARFGKVKTDIVRELVKTIPK